MRERVRDRFDFSVIRNLRRERGMSTEALADKAGLTRAAIARMEAGNGNPTIETIEALAGALGLPASTLVRLAEGVKLESAQPEDFSTESYRGKRVRFRGLNVYWLKAKAGSHIASELELHRDNSETCLLLSGCLTFTVGKVSSRLTQGMAVRFNGIHDHQFDIIEDSEFLLIQHSQVSAYIPEGG
jgi:transcriptional regulator with XRE-family HTH domain